MAAESPSDSAPTGAPQSAPTPTADIAGLGSLFDLEAPAAAAPTAEAPAAQEPEPSPEPAEESPGRGGRGRSGGCGARAGACAVVDRQRLDADDRRRPGQPRLALRPRGTRDDDRDHGGHGVHGIDPGAGVRRAGRGSPDRGTDEATPRGAPAADVTAEATEPEPQPEPETAAAPPSGADLSQAATFRDPEDLPAQPATTEPVAEVRTSRRPPNEPQAEEPQPSSSDAPTHTPRTDVDISGSGSLFDL